MTATVSKTDEKGLQYLANKSEIDMSLDAISWAFQQDIKPAVAKFVLLAMADRAGEDHTCFPSIDRLVLDTSLNRRTVLSSLRLLRAKGFIEDTNKRTGKSNRVIVYRLIGVVNRHDRNSLKNGTVKQSQKRTKTVPKTVLLRHPDSPSLSLFAQNEHNSQTVQTDADPPAISPFARFWQAYPKKRSKGQAEKAFKKLNPSEQFLETMLASIERARTSEQWLDEGGLYIPYPATWLNAKGWEDEIEPPPPPGAQAPRSKTGQALLALQKLKR